MSAQSAFAGFQDLESFGSQFNATAFLIQSILSTVRTATLVKIIKCTNSGGLALAGTVDVQPLVNQVDGDGNLVEHGTIYKCLYSRVQGGANAIIMDPQAGDIGVMIFADRDTSKVIATKTQASPGSGRRFDMADGIYIGWVLNGVPSQYIQYNEAGIKIHSPTLIDLEAPDIQLNAQTVEINAQTVAINASTSATVTTPTFTVVGNTVMHGSIAQTGGASAAFSGSMDVTGDVVAEGISVHSHTHSDPQGGNTGPPN